MSRSRDEILLEEKVAQVDDVNFDKIYDLNEITTKELSNFDKEITLNSKPDCKYYDYNDHSQQNLGDDVAFSFEVQTNEFLDNMNWHSKEEKSSKIKSKLKDKPLIFAFTSIMTLLCILFIYNMFVINKLEYSAGQAQALTSSSVSSSVNVDYENDYIEFENGNNLVIRNYPTVKSDDLSQTSNWFDSLINGVKQLFGGNY